MNQCPKCHKLLLGNFCPDCGVKTETLCQCPTSIECPQCGQTVWSRFTYKKSNNIPKYCEKCGFEIIGNSVIIIKSNDAASYYVVNGSLLLVDGYGISRFNGAYGYRIPDDVMCICNGAFQNCLFASTSIYIPKSIKYIQNGAFNGKEIDGDATYPKNLYYEGTKNKFLDILEITDYGGTAVNFICNYGSNAYIDCSDGYIKQYDLKLEIERRKK